MKRVSVCEGDACRDAGADAVWSAAQRWHAELKLENVCVLARGGCYGLCAQAPNVLVRPETVALQRLTAGGDFAPLGLPGEVHHAEVDPLRMARILHAIRNQS